MKNESIRASSDIVRIRSDSVRVRPIVRTRRHPIATGFLGGHNSLGRIDSNRSGKLLFGRDIRKVFLF